MFHHQQIMQTHARLLGGADLHYTSNEHKTRMFTFKAVNEKFTRHPLSIIFQFLSGLPDPLQVESGLQVQPMNDYLRLGDKYGDERTTGS